MAKAKTTATPTAVKYPEPIKLQDPETGDPIHDPAPDGSPIPDSHATIDFARFVRQTVMGDGRWGQSTEYIWSAGCILSAITEGKKTGEINLEDEHWERLKEIAKAPSRQGTYGPIFLYSAFYNVVLLPQLSPFLKILGGK